ncbi:MAG: pantothenate kinase [Elainellaceae cyanobacterium]
MATGSWLGLLIGNTQLHWGRFEQGTLVAHWQQPHFDPAQPQPNSNLGIPSPEPTVTPLDNVPAAHRPLLAVKQVCLASVVPQQTSYWQPYCQQPITLEQIPLQGTYPTLGVDRALALWGAGQHWGFPVLVVDGGTALTYTGTDATKTLVGGAILPGLGLQLRSLHQSTALLPIVKLNAEPTGPLDVPTTRWAKTTEAAIQSGIFHSAIAGAESFLQDWRSRFPHSPVVFTGGDGGWLYHSLSVELRPHTYYEPNLGLWGLQHICRRTNAQR